MTSLGTYANSIKHEGGGLYLPSDDGISEYLRIINELFQERQSCELFIRRKIGDEAFLWIDRQTVLENIITAYCCLENVENDSRSPIVHAGNGLESFLIQVGTLNGISLIGANGIIQKVERLPLPEKIKAKGRFLGHIRNASDHGVDPVIGHQWTIYDTTAIEYIYVSMNFIRCIVAQINGRYEL